MQIIFLTLILFSVSIGIIYLFNFLQYCLLSSKDYEQIYSNFVLIPISGHIDDIELLARKYSTKYKINGCFKGTKIVFIDSGLDEETKNICERFCDNKDNFTLCNKLEFYAMLKNEIE